MTIYNYDKNTGEYLFSSEEIVRNGVDIIPAFTTKEKPLEEEEGFIVIYKNSKWQYKELPVKPELTYQEKRELEYKKVIPIGDQLDAILKAFEMVLGPDSQLPTELVDIIDKWQSIKSAYPKT